MSIRPIQQAKFADPDPAIIQFLKIILNEKSPAKRREWATDALRTILSNWKKTENMEQLNADLGLNIKKRRHAATVRAEQTIAIACVKAAIDGDKKPFKAAADLHCDGEMHRVYTAWREWGDFYIAQFESDPANAAAIKRLRSQNNN
jgi:hypothetical protein